MNTPIPYLGESLALLTAFIWASAVILFKKSGESVHPIALNLFKTVMATVLIIPTMWLFGETFFRPVSTSDYILLLLSGVIGIGLSDTMFFKSLNLLGAGLSAIVDCLYSPFIIGLSVLWIGERLNGWQVLGVVMIVAAVLTATSKEKQNRISSRNLIWGIIWGVAAMASMAVGIVMIKPMLEHSPVLWATEVRLIGGGITLILILLFYPSRRAVINSLLKSHNWKYTISGSFLGAYLAMIVWLAGMKFAQASIASALNQTSNVLVFIFAAILLKEPVNTRKIIGIGLGVGGAFLVTFG
ncbi:MAG: DMT family transporter [Candidatus Hatepunaea meridiana]|nr:DMT family transporter [Candidatus Hatepunaea meridiana]